MNINIYKKDDVDAFIGRMECDDFKLIRKYHYYDLFTEYIINASSFKAIKIIDTILEKSKEVDLPFFFDDICFEVLRNTLYDYKMFSRYFPHFPNQGQNKQLGGCLKEYLEGPDDSCDKKKICMLILSFSNVEYCVKKIASMYLFGEE